MNYFEERHKKLLLTYINLIDCLLIFLDLLDLNTIANQKRIQTYKEGKKIILKVINKEINIDQMYEYLPKAILEKINDYDNNKELILLKEPYNGVKFKNNKIYKLNKSNNKWEKWNIIDIYKNLIVLKDYKVSIKTIKKLINAGYKNIKEIEISKNKIGKEFTEKEKEEIYRYLNRKDKKYFDLLVNFLKNNIFYDINYYIGGSYARNEKIINDLDYVICYNGKEQDIINKICDRLHKNNIKFKATNKIIKILWKDNTTKIDVFIYDISSNPKSCIFAKFARYLNKYEQQKIKLLAKNKGLKLSDKDLYNIEEPHTINYMRIIDKQYPETFNDIINFIKEYPYKA